MFFTRPSSSKEALTTFIYYSCYDSHARSCLTKVQSIYGNRRKMKAVRRPLMLHIKGCEASCPCMSHLFLDVFGRVRESHVICGWWCHLPWACSFMPVRLYFFYKHSFCTSGVVLNTGVLACIVFVGRVCSCPGVYGASMVPNSLCLCVCKGF